MFAWINRRSETATWSNLVEALTEVGQRKIAQEIAETRGTCIEQFIVVAMNRYII